MSWFISNPISAEDSDTPHFGGFFRNTPRITPMAHPTVDPRKPTTPRDSYASRWNVDDGICDSSSNFTARRAIASSGVLPRTRFGRTLPGATYWGNARQEPSASRYTEPSPFDALPCTRTLPFRLTLRLPVIFLAMVRMP